MAKNFQTLIVSDIREETADAVCVSFEIPEALQPDFKFKPGQYLTLRSVIDGTEVRRSYSICSSSCNLPRVGIKQVEGGVFSTFAHKLKPGDRLGVFPPAGRFTLDTEEAKGGEYLLVAAGSGITPILSIAQSLLETDREATVTMVYGNRNTASIMFKRELEMLKDRYLDRFQLFHVLSREAQDVDFLNGHIDAELIEKLFKTKILRIDSISEAFICGPAGMNEEVGNALEKQGLSREFIRTEHFKSNGQKSKPLADGKKQQAPERVVADVIIDGTKHSIRFENANDTVLEAATKSGFEIPYSCSGGMCATCRCKLIEGSVEMDKNYALAEWELESGFVLGCQSRPKSEKIVLDFDAV